MKNRRLLIFAVVAVLMGVSAALFGAISVAGGKFPPGPSEADVASAQSGGSSHSGMIYSTRDRVVNLADAGALRYLKVTIALEVFDPEHPGGKPSSDEHKNAKAELPKDLRARAVAMEDAITATLSAKTATQLMRPEGKVQLKDELKSTLNGLLGGERILAVYFTDFIIQ